MKKVSGAVQPRVIVVIEPVEVSSALFTMDQKVENRSTCHCFSGIGDKTGGYFQCVTVTVEVHTRNMLVLK